MYFNFSLIFYIFSVVKVFKVEFHKFSLQILFVFKFFRTLKFTIKKTDIYIKKIIPGEAHEKHLVKKKKPTFS